MSHCYMILMYVVYIFHSLSCVLFKLFISFQTTNNDTTKYNCIPMQISKELKKSCLVNAIKCAYFGPWTVSWDFCGYSEVDDSAVSVGDSTSSFFGHTIPTVEEIKWINVWQLVASRGQQGGHRGH